MVETLSRKRDAGQPSAPNGAWLVLGIVAVAIGLGAFAVWFQWGQTRRCLAFFGPAATQRIQSAARVELWRLTADGDTIRALERWDVSQAPGLVHLRRGLIEDVNYSWLDSDRAGQSSESPASGRLPPAAWDVAVAFCEPATEAPSQVAPADQAAAHTTVLAFDLDDGGAVTVVGQPGRVALGRLAPGLRTWVNDTVKRVLDPGKPAF